MPRPAGIGIEILAYQSSLANGTKIEHMGRKFNGDRLYACRQRLGGQGAKSGLGLRWGIALGPKIRRTLFPYVGLLIAWITKDRAGSSGDVISATVEKGHLLKSLA